MMEAAVGLPVFIMMIVLAVDLTMASYRTAGLFYTLSAATRWAALGATVSGQTRVQSIETTVQQIGSKYGLSLTPSEISVCRLGQKQCSPETAESPEQYIQVSAVMPVSVLFGLFSINVSHSVMAKNEPYL